ncbi:hypothetical protein J2T37_001053 [Neisseria perflava]|nr:hypothetical protein [Neisseria perflava]MCP1772753.1 hypothetical protein [Neisseria perflava]
MQMIETAQAESDEPAIATAAAKPQDDEIAKFGGLLHWFL